MKTRLRWDCSTACFSDGTIKRGVGKFVKDVVPDDFVFLPTEIAIETNRYRNDECYRNEIKQLLINYEDELLRWYYDAGWRVGVNERKTMFGFVDAERRRTQAMKYSRRDGWFDRELQRQKRLNATVELVKQQISTL